MWVSRRPALFDAVTAIAALVLLGTVDVIRSGTWALIADVLLAGAFAVRRLHPLLALGIAWIAAAVQVIVIPSVIFGDLLIVGIVYVSGLSPSRRARWAGLGSSVVGGVVAGIKLVLIRHLFLHNVPQSHPGWLIVAFDLAAVSGVIAAALALFWALGVATRNRRALIEERFERMEAERERLQAELRVAREAERIRISREMHDAIGHALTVVIAQSDGARYALESDSDAPLKALAIINSAARTAMEDVGALLDVLAGPGQHEGSVGVAQLAALTSAMEASGLRIVYHHAVNLNDLPLSVDVAVYRVVQECLTNALKHGGRGTRVDVSVQRDDEKFELRTTTIEPEPHRAHRQAGRSGHGIAGMSERARLLGGSLIAEARKDGVPGFLVVMSLPIGSPR